MKKYCDTCGQSRDVTTKEIRDTFRVKDKEVDVTITITTCDVCGNEVYNEEQEKKNDLIVFDAYRRKSNLLTTDEIKAIREKYGLSQAKFSEILGFGKKTITRYENGSIQDTVHDNLMRLFDRKFNAAMIFEWRKNDINPKTRTTMSFALSNQDVDETRFEYSTTTRYAFPNHNLKIYDSNDGEKNVC